MPRWSTESELNDISGGPMSHDATSGGFPFKKKLSWVSLIRLRVLHHKLQTVRYMGSRQGSRTSSCLNVTPKRKPISEAG